MTELPPDARHLALPTGMEAFTRAAVALMAHAHHGSDLVALLHRGPHVARAEVHLRDFIAGLLRAGAEAGELRDDVPPEELAAFCLHALAAASTLPSTDAVRRLVAVTLAGLRLRR